MAFSFSAADDDVPQEDSANLVSIPQKQEVVRAIEVASAAPLASDTTALQTQVRQIQTVTARPLSTLLRRLFLLWLRIYVRESKGAKESRVNLCVPIPLPIVGALFQRRLTPDRALKILAPAQQEADRSGAVETYLESQMAVEFIRVEETDNKGRRTLVVIGLD